MQQYTLLYATSNEYEIIRPVGNRKVSKKLSLVSGVELGTSPLENAKIKARSYYDAFRKQSLNILVFSCDTGLYFDNIPEEYQPGIHVRHIGGKCLTDEEMVIYYSQLAKKFGSLTARYRNAICFYKDEEYVYESMDDKLSGKPFLLVQHPRDKIRSIGFPLDSISVQIESGTYYYDLEDCNRETCTLDEFAMDNGFCIFFQKCLECF